MRGCRIFLLLTLAMGSSMAGSGLATVSSGDLSFFIDTAVFRLAGTDTLALEVYESIPVGQLAQDGGLVSFQTDAVLLSASGDTLAVRQWISETEWIEGRSVVNSTVMVVEPGEQTLSVTVTDLSNGRRGASARNLAVEAPSAMSEMEVANIVMPAVEDSHNPLRKGNLVIFPAADSRFDLPGESMAYIYSEVYGMGGESLRRQSRLTDASGGLLFARPWDVFDIPEGAEAVGLLDSLSLAGARVSGLHYLEVALVASGDTLLERKPIMIMNEAGESAEPVVQAGGGGAADYLDELPLLLTPSEKSIYDGLSDTAAREAFYGRYWASRPEARADFEARCREAGSFSTVFREGWQTDRGRVYIKFGRPDDVERMPLQVGTAPFETWSYEQGGRTFVFVDTDGTGNYVQVYSTVPGEVSYSNWERMLSPIGVGSSGDM